jgi:hypothetical protein
VRHAVESFHQVREALVGDGQRIATREDHLVDRRVGGQPVERAAPPLSPAGVVLVREVTAEAVAAVDPARSGDEQQRAPAVLVEHARHRSHRRRRVLADLGQGIVGVTRRRLELGGRRQDLEQQRIVGVAAAHPRDEAAGHAQRERSSGVRCRAQRRRKLA